MPFVRLIWAAVDGVRSMGVDPMEESVFPMRVWPNDLDTNLHMNNGRYLTLMDIGRWHWAIRTGVASQCLRQGWQPVLGGAWIAYMKSLRPFQKYVLGTRLIYWDEKWFYIEQRFYSKGKLAARGVVRGLFRTRSGNLHPAKLAQYMGANPKPPPMPDSVRNWPNHKPAEFFGGGPAPKG